MINEVLTQIGAEETKKMSKNILDSLGHTKVTDSDVIISAEILNGLKNEPGGSQDVKEKNYINKIKSRKSDVKKILMEMIKGEKLELVELAKAVLLKKIMAGSDCKAEDLSKLCRIEDTLLKEGVQAATLSRTISSLIHPLKKATLDMLKKPLEELAKGKSLAVSAADLEYSEKVSSGNDQKPRLELDRRSERCD